MGKALRTSSKQVASTAISCCHCSLLWWPCHHRYGDVTARQVSEAQCLGETIQKPWTDLRSDSTQPGRPWPLGSDHGGGNSRRPHPLSRRSPLRVGAGASLLDPNGGPTCGMKLPETDSLRLTVPVADIKAIVTGKDCPHMKEKSALKQNKVSGAAGLSLRRRCGDSGAQPVAAAAASGGWSRPKLLLNASVRTVLMHTEVDRTPCTGHPAAGHGESCASPPLPPRVEESLRVTPVHLQISAVSGLGGPLQHNHTTIITPKKK